MEFVVFNVPPTKESKRLPPLCWLEYFSGVFLLCLSLVSLCISLPSGVSFLVSFQCEEGRLSPSALGIKDAVSFLGVAAMGFVLLLLARGRPLLLLIHVQHERAMSSPAYLLLVGRSKNVSSSIHLTV